MVLGSTQPPTEMSTRNRLGEEWGVKRCRYLRLTTSSSVSRLTRQCGSLDVSQRYRPPNITFETHMVWIKHAASALNTLNLIDAARKRVMFGLGSNWSKMLYLKAVRKRKWNSPSLPKKKKMPAQNVVVREKKRWKWSFAWIDAPKSLLITVRVMEQSRTVYSNYCLLIFLWGKKSGFVDSKFLEASSIWNALYYRL
jgi:hypothetical protein